MAEKEKENTGPQDAHKPGGQQTGFNVDKGRVGGKKGQMPLLMVALQRAGLRRSPLRGTVRLFSWDGATDFAAGDGSWFKHGGGNGCVTNGHRTTQCTSYMDSDPTSSAGWTYLCWASGLCPASPRSLVGRASGEGG